jgi:NADH-quinone oxidoreductase subunit M
VWRGPVVDPGTLNLVFLPTFNYYPLIAIGAALGIIVTAGYVLNVVQRVFFGEFDVKHFSGVADVTLIDKTALVLLCSVLIVVGIYPQIMSTMIQYSMSPIVTLIQR